MKFKVHNNFDRDRVIGYIKRLDIAKPFTVEVTERRTVRTIPQNRLYRLWLTCISSETGNDIDDLHEYFKRKFLEPKEITIFGEVELRYTTTDLNTAQFAHYLEDIRAFAASELSITLPDPDDQIWESFYDYYRDR